MTIDVAENPALGLVARRVGRRWSRWAQAKLRPDLLLSVKPCIDSILPRGL